MDDAPVGEGSVRPRLAHPDAFSLGDGRKTRPPGEPGLEHPVALERRARRILLASGVASASLALALGWPCLRGPAPCSPDGLLLTADQRGRRAFTDGRFDAAAAAFVDPAWRASALYRSGDFEQAADVWATLPGARAAYDRGNALVLLGRYEKAVTAYERALAGRPGWEEAIANRAIAALRAARAQAQGDERTGGALEADDVVFDDAPAKADGGAEEAGDDETDEATRALWLRQVDTRPGDFLRSRFAYELARREGSSP